MLFDHALDVELERLGGHFASFLESAAGRDAAGEIGKIDPVVAIRILAQQGDVDGHGELLGQSDAGLPLDALEGSDGHVLPWMLHRHSVGVVGMPELMVAALDSGPVASRLPGASG